MVKYIPGFMYTIGLLTMVPCNNTLTGIVLAVLLRNSTGRKILPKKANNAPWD